VPDKSSGIAGATLSLTQTVTSFTGFLPRLSEVRKAGKDDRAMRGDVRLGEIAAFAVSMGIATTMSALTDSPIPVYAAMFTAVLLIIVFETALRGEGLLER
jgi:hypothetical protein